jgi:two-component system response regulator FixJ
MAKSKSEEKINTADPIIYVVDDDVALCNSIHWLLQSVNLKVAHFYSAQDFLNAYNPKQPGCLLLDIRMPVMGGLELFEEINKRRYRLSVIFITGHGDVPMAVSAMQNGAADFILKPFNDQLLIQKVQKALAEDKKRREKYPAPEAVERLNQLTARENEIAQSIVAGRLSKEIAFELSISESTVDFHRGNLMRKLKIKTVAELVKLYMLQDML